MSVFQFDEKQAGSGFDALPVGEYECIISGIEQKTSGAGNDMLKLELTVREDVDQVGGKRKFFDNLVFTEKALFKVHQILKAIGIESGKNYDSYVDMIKDLAYKPVRLKNKHEEYNGDQKDRVNYYMETKHPIAGGIGSTQADPFSVPAAAAISDDDLPF